MSIYNYGFDHLLNKTQTDRTKGSIYDYGFDGLLNQPNSNQESPLVYNVVEERLSGIVQTSDTITNLIPGLPETTI